MEVGDDPSSLTCGLGASAVRARAGRRVPRGSGSGEAGWRCCAWLCWAAWPGSWPKGEQECGLGEQAGCGLHGQLNQAEKREEKKTFSFYKT